MAQEEDEPERSPISTKPIASPANNVVVVQSQASSSPANHQSNNSNNNNNDTSPSSKTFIKSAARKLASQPLERSDPAVWAVLTAVSDCARKRPQGMNILLTDDEHRIGRLVPDTRFRIDSLSVSGRHCTITRKRVASKDVEQSSCSRTSVVFLKDTSTNGTFVNGEKLKKGLGIELHHGDIVSFAAVPHHEAAFAFVYREVSNSVSSTDGAPMKRKADDFVGENKRLKGIGIGAPEGPISLDDVRSLQRSNKDLRKQLESHVLTIESMRNESRIATASHENELKEVRESISQSYQNEIKELNQTLEVKQKELVQFTALSTERQQAIVDLTERLNASIQSRADADEIIASQKAIISEREEQLDEERNQRREEREKYLADHKAALHKAQVEAQEELKRQSDNASKQERELKEVISKLQESDKESRQLVETLRSKLEDTRESLVLSEKRVRQLEAQVQEEQQVSLKGKKRIDTLENELTKLGKELENEKQVAREEAWAKVSALELEMEAAIRDLTVEKQRFQGARERIILRETQLRSFYSTTEEITAVFVKQQEQLKAMRKTLEDEENYENMSFDIDENAAKEKINEAIARGKDIVTPQKNSSVRESSEASIRRIDRVQVESSSDEASATEKHECDHGNEEGENHTQDMECNSAERTVNGPFGSDIDGVGTIPEVEGDPIETERVLETESPANDTTSGGRNIDLNKLTVFTGDTMQLDDDQVQENGDTPKVNDEKTESCKPHEVVTVLEDTETTGVRTTDLLTSEKAGSWAIDTAPSVHGENESPRSDDDMAVVRNDSENAAAVLCTSDGQAAGSEVAAGSSKLNQERQALNAMIQIVAPDFKEQFAGASSNNDQDKDVASVSDSDTQGNSDDEGEAVGSDEDNTQAGSDVGDEDEDEDDVMEDERQEDSLG